jgi:BASS family bile acid:Na+ symporter
MRLKTFLKATGKALRAAGPQIATGLGIGFAVARLLHLQKPKCVALSIEVGMQNSGLASSLAVLHFAAYPLATIPGAVFSVWHNISGALIAKLYSFNITNETKKND